MHDEYLKFYLKSSQSMVLKSKLKEQWEDLQSKLDLQKNYVTQHGLIDEQPLEEQIMDIKQRIRITRHQNAAVLAKVPKFTSIR
eukprot:m.163260 g.163260  ORF g.163260 m.163260 type:complete len:84 (+) comp38850_c0_seq17:11-262(+)